MADLLQMAFSIGVTLLVIAGVLLGINNFKVTIACGPAYDILGSTLTMFTNFGSQLGTVGTMLGVSLILAVIGVGFLGITYLRDRGSI